MYSSTVFSFFPKCAHGVFTNVHTCAHIRHLILCFFLSRRSMNKTGAQRLSEEQRETWVVAGRSLCSSGGVFVLQSPCLDLQDYSSLDTDCSENSPFFFSFGLTCLCKHAHTHTSIDDQVRTHLPRCKTFPIETCAVSFKQGTKLPMGCLPFCCF